jgi:hypothetical protein
MAKEEFLITEITCLKSKVLSTGRPRVLRVSEMEGDLWDRLVDATKNQPSHFQVQRELAQSHAEASQDMEQISIGKMLQLKREDVAPIAEFYGIMDTGQTRATMIGQIKSERQKQAELIASEK